MRASRGLTVNSRSGLLQCRRTPRPQILSRAPQKGRRNSSNPHAGEKTRPRIYKALDLEQALKEALRILSASLAMERATVTLLDTATEELVIMASHGLTEQERLRGVYKTTEGATGKIFRTAHPLHIPNVSNYALFLNKTRAREVEDYPVSYTGVPIILGNEPIGVLSVDRLFGKDVDAAEDIDFLNVVATLLAQLIRINETVRKREEALRRENVTLKYQLSKETRGLYIVGASPPMQEVERQIEKVSPTKATVLLLGESGTGKTLIARIIHELSERRSHPFIKVNCASIPENLLAAELFGYEKGSFTGATSTKPGRFEDAHNSSIFLDEIGELEHLIERLVIMADGDRIDEALIRLALDPVAGSKPTPIGPTPANRSDKLDGQVVRKPFLRDMEKTEIISALRDTAWIKRRAAQVLGITERQLGYRIRKYGLEDRVAAERMRLRASR